MVITVTIMRMVKMLADKVINMVAMRHCLMAAIWTMNVTLLVLAAVVAWSTISNVLLADWKDMLCHLTTIFLMIHFSMVEIIYMSIVVDLHVPAIRSVDV